MLLVIKEKNQLRKKGKENENKRFNKRTKTL